MTLFDYAHKEITREQFKEFIALLLVELNSDAYKNDKRNNTDVMNYLSGMSNYLVTLSSGDEQENDKQGPAPSWGQLAGLFYAAMRYS